MNAASHFVKHIHLWVRVLEPRGSIDLALHRRCSSSGLVLAKYGMEIGPVHEGHSRGPGQPFGSVLLTQYKYWAGTELLVHWLCDGTALVLCSCYAGPVPKHHRSVVALAPLPPSEL